MIEQDLQGEHDKGAQENVASSHPDNPVHPVKILKWERKGARNLLDPVSGADSTFKRTT